MFTPVLRGAAALLLPLVLTAGPAAAQSQHGGTRVTFGGMVQEDGRFGVHGRLPVGHFALRKLRPTVTGRVARLFEFRVMPDFGNGTAALYDAYVDVRMSPALRLRVGKDKTPVGYELLQRDPTLVFPERALASALVPNRDVGIQLQGEAGGHRVGYAAGVFDKDLAARVVVQPFRGAAAAPVRGLGFHVGGSRGHEAAPLTALRTSVGQRYFGYAPRAAAAGRRARLSPAVFYYHKAFGVFAERMWTAQVVARDGERRDVNNAAWQVTGAYVLTGETAVDGAVRPLHPLDPGEGHWGALQLVARYAEVTVDADAFAAALAAPGSSRAAHAWTVGANWYPVAWAKWYATFERTDFDAGDGTARQPEDVVLLRVQLSF